MKVRLKCIPSLTVLILITALFLVSTGYSQIPDHSVQTNDPQIEDRVAKPHFISNEVVVKLKEGKGFDDVRPVFDKHRLQYKK